MNNGIKALLGAALLSCVMIGCESTQTRGACPDGGDCNPAQCEDTANCDPSTCETPNCPLKAEACPDGKGAACPDGAKGAACPDGAKGAAHCPDGKKSEACGPDCTKPCCAAQEVCSHPNSTFTCPNCTDDKYCCGDCAAKDAAACPDCNG